jgi:di/tricarboxylate transporter
MDYFKIMAISVFILMYIGLLVFPKYRYLISPLAGLILVIFQVFPIGQVLTAINWNVILMLTGTMGLVTLFINSAMPSTICDFLLSKVNSG